MSDMLCLVLVLKYNFQNKVIIVHTEYSYLRPKYVYTTVHVLETEKIVTRNLST